MCGLVAVVTSDTFATGTKEWFHDAMIASQVRGTDSTGIFQVAKDRKITHQKEAWAATQFVKHVNVAPIITEVPRSPLTVGHVRAATRGIVNKVNAHPFKASREDGTEVIGVHNGTLEDWDDSVNDVDSAWAIEMLAKEGPFDAFEHLKGKFAFIWYDTAHPDHVFMTRNDQRPLHFYKTPDSKTLLFSSELGMLGWLAEKHEFHKRGATNADDKRFFWLSPGKIYKFSLKDVGSFEEFDRPHYDPKNRKPIMTYPSRGTADMVPWAPAERNQAYYDRLAEGWDDDGGFTGTGGTQGKWETNQVRTLKHIKRVLGKARLESDIEKRKLANGETVTSNAEAVVTQDDLNESLEDAIKTAINEHEREKREGLDTWRLTQGMYYTFEPNNRNATNEEIKKAKDSHMYSLAVAFIGVMYDDDTSELLGDAYVKTAPNTAPVKFDCIVRGLSKRAAHAQFIDVREPVPTAIVGATAGIMSGETAFIVAPLRKESLDLLKYKVKSGGDVSHIEYQMTQYAAPTADDFEHIESPTIH